MSTLPRSLVYASLCDYSHFVGAVFSCKNQTVNAMPFGTHLQEDQQERNSKRPLFNWGYEFLLLILIARLFYVQIIQADLNIRLSKENAMRLKIVTPPRGEILTGMVLFLPETDHPILYVFFLINLKTEKMYLNSLCQDTRYERVILFLTAQNYDSTIQRANFRRFDATRLKEDVSLDLVSIIEEHSMELPGIIVETESDVSILLVLQHFTFLVI